MSTIADTERATPADAIGDRLLEAKDVAAMLNVPVSWVREHTRSGRIPHVPLGRYVRYRRSAVLSWLADQETAGAPWGRYRPRAR